eukprot:1161863-Pelagomonas_calceolata.AAC.2
MAGHIRKIFWGVCGAGPGIQKIAPRNSILAGKMASWNHIATALTSGYLKGASMLNKSTALCLPDVPSVEYSESSECGMFREDSNGIVKAKTWDRFEPQQMWGVRGGYLKGEPAGPPVLELEGDPLTHSLGPALAVCSSSVLLPPSLRLQLTLTVFYITLVCSSSGLLPSSLRLQLKLIACFDETGKKSSKQGTMGALWLL